jgi:hypothetical protein
MKYLVEIDDTTETGKSILHVLKNLSESDKSVVIKSLEELEHALDEDLAEKIQEGLKSEDVSRSDVMKALGKE